jgi:hypothetical protein
MNNYLYRIVGFMVITLLLASCGTGADRNAWRDANVKAITAYSLNGVTGTINNTNKTIAVTLPYGSNVTALVAKFNHTGTSVTIGTTSQVSETTVNNFISPLVYTVANTGGISVDYTVTVTVALNSANVITNFKLNGASGTINETNTPKTIAVTAPYGTNITALVATFAIPTGASVKVGTAPQSSGITTNDFTSPLTYTVTAADGYTTSYTVTVTVALNTAKAILTFFINGVSGTISETDKTISVPFQLGTNVTALVTTFTTTGANVKIGSTVQVSANTVNNFTSPIVYTVTAADNTTASYTASVKLSEFTKTIAANTLNYNLKTDAIAAGWDQATPLHAIITIGSGVVIGSTSISTYAFTVPALVTGSTVNIINNGTISGKGGNGGFAEAGGPALSAAWPVSITNYNIIQGGGGGGPTNTSVQNTLLVGGGGVQEHKLELAIMYRVADIQQAVILARMERCQQEVVGVTLAVPLV